MQGRTVADAIRGVYTSLLACGIVKLPHALERRRYFEDRYMASLPASALSTGSTHPDAIPHAVAATHTPITVLIVVPTRDGGASDPGAVELVRILSEAGHHAIVVSRAGRLVADVTAAGGEFVPLDVSSNNPVVILRNAFTLTRLARERRCVAIHAFGRAAAWSGFIAATL